MLLEMEKHVTLINDLLTRRGLTNELKSKDDKASFMFVEDFPPLHAYKPFLKCDLLESCFFYSQGLCINITVNKPKD